MSNTLQEMMIGYRELIDPRDDIEGIIARGEAAERLERLGYHALRNDLGEAYKFDGEPLDLSLEGNALVLATNGIRQVTHGAFIENLRHSRAIAALGQPKNEARLMRAFDANITKTRAVVKVMHEMQLASWLQLPRVSGL